MSRTYNAEIMHIFFVVKNKKKSHALFLLISSPFSEKWENWARVREENCVENLLDGKTGESNSLMFSVKRILRLLWGVWLFSGRPHWISLQNGAYWGWKVNFFSLARKIVARNSTKIRKNKEKLKTTSHIIIK